MTNKQQGTYQEQRSSQVASQAGFQSERSQEQTVDQAPPPKKGLRGLFDDLSIAQVIAGALAAATVFLLSSTIGIAGSLIGTAVGSIVSAVSSQVYKKILSASADKIRDVTPDKSEFLGGHTTASSALGDAEGSGEGESAADKDAAHGGTHAGSQATTHAGSQATTVLKGNHTSTLTATQVMNANDIRYKASEGNQEEDPALRLAHARRSRKAKVQRNVIIVSIVSALITIAVSAAVINFATAGEGIGTKTDPIFPTPAATEQQDHAQQSATTHENAGQQQNQGSATTPEGQPSTTTPDSGSSQGSNDDQASGSGTSGSGSASTGSDSNQQGQGSSTGSGSSDGSTSNGSSSGSGSNNQSSNASSNGSGSNGSAATGSSGQ